jgi:hypothetical protein
MDCFNYQVDDNDLLISCTKCSAPGAAQTAAVRLIELAARNSPFRFRQPGRLSLHFAYSCWFSDTSRATSRATAHGLQQ